MEKKREEITIDNNTLLAFLFIKLNVLTQSILNTLLKKKIIDGSDLAKEVKKVTSEITNLEISESEILELFNKYKSVSSNKEKLEYIG